MMILAIIEEMSAFEASLPGTKEPVAHQAHHYASHADYGLRASDMNGKRRAGHRHFLE